MRKRSRFRIKTIEFFVVYPKLDVPPLYGHAGISPTTQIGAILYKIIHRSRGRQDAIDFVTIAIPSLRSLRHSHK